ncbi:MAG: dihydroorotate dehydrogenase-like protein [Candidatus Cloacimonadota bacterium]|nr:dihydroorotate dehydrogenase-like protein [Candidatus Cloacimonadota bacterium]
MANLQTKYMNLELKNPIIVGSSGLTNSVDSIKELANNGAAAVVLKSLFEEQIMMEIDKSMKYYPPAHSHTETEDYLSYFEKKHHLEKYLNLIKDTKKTVDIPIIASINCRTASEWINFAEEIEKAGADGLELNIFLLPSDFKQGIDGKLYFEIIKKIRAKIKIPIAVKIGYYFNNLAQHIVQLSRTDINGLVLFNRTYNPDIDIEKEELVASEPLSCEHEIAHSIRWLGIVSPHTDCSLAATGGIHNAESVLKEIFVGADAVQIVSVLYKKSATEIKRILENLETWLDKKQYDSIQKFKGKLARTEISNPQFYERVQFMKYLQGEA